MAREAHVLDGGRARRVESSRQVSEQRPRNDKETKYGSLNYSNASTEDI